MSDPQIFQDKRVLIVDDNPINRTLAAAFTKRLGMVSDQAADGAAALALIAANRYDAVLLDISMPGMSGEEVLVHIRRDAASGSLPVIAYTAHALPDEKQGLLAAGFDDLLIKPVTMGAMEAVLAGVLTR